MSAYGMAYSESENTFPRRKSFKANDVMVDSGLEVQEIIPGGNYNFRLVNNKIGDQHYP